MLEFESNRRRAEAKVKLLTDEELVDALEAPLTEELVSEELTRRLGARGLTYSLISNEEQIVVWIKPETKS